MKSEKQIKEMYSRLDGFLELSREGSIRTNGMDRARVQHQTEILRWVLGLKDKPLEIKVHNQINPIIKKRWKRN